MLSRLFLATVCALCLQGTPAWSDGIQPHPTANGKGRSTLCIAGYIETRMGCLPATDPKLSALASFDMQHCMSASAASMQGYRARYLRCSQMQLQQPGAKAP